MAYIPPNRYLAGTGLGSYGVSLGFTPKEKRVIKRVNKARDRRIAQGRDTRKVNTTTTAGPGALTTAVAAATGNPWDNYLAQLDAREKAARDEAIRAQQESSRGLMGSLGGFGRALQDNAAEAWLRATQGYGAGAAEQGAFQGAVADQYSQGLQAANEQIARDYAAIGQSGTPTADPNAVAQVASVAGANPAGTMGLVGKAWESYGKTTPGTVGFMTEQNMLQVGRESLQAEQQIRAEFAAAMADNPESAMKMWQGVQQYEMAKSQADAEAAQNVIENQLALAKNKREEDAAKLLYQKFLADQGKNAWQIAKDMTNFSGTVWAVDKNGTAYDTGRTAPGSRAGTAATTAATAAASLQERISHNQVIEQQAYDRIGISGENLKLAQQREARMRKGEKKGGYSAADKRQFGQDARKIAGRWYYGVPNKNFDPSKDPGPENPKYTTQIGTPEQALREMIGAGIPYSVAWPAIYQYAIQAGPERPGWQKALSWNPQYDSPARRAKAKKGAANRQPRGGR